MIDPHVAGPVGVEILPKHGRSRNRFESHTLIAIPPFLVTLDDIAPPRIVRLRDERKIGPSPSAITHEIDHEGRNPASLGQRFVSIKVVIVKAVNVVPQDRERLYVCGVAAPALKLHGTLGDAADHRVFAIYERRLGDAGVGVDENLIVAAVDFGWLISVLASGVSLG